MKYISKFFYDLLYGLPAFSNLKWGIIQDWREKHGYYKMERLSLSLITKYGLIITHKRGTVEAKNINKLFKAIHDYNEVIDKL